MSRSFIGAIFIFVTALFWSSVARTEGKTLVIGRVSDDPRRTYGELKPMVEYVVSHLMISALQTVRLSLLKTQRR